MNYVILIKKRCKVVIEVIDLDNCCHAFYKIITFGVTLDLEGTFAKSKYDFIVFIYLRLAIPMFSCVQKC